MKNKRERAGLAQRLSEAFPDQDLNAQLHFVEHHRAHLASAFFASPFEKAAVVSVDGFGDFASSAWGVGTVQLYLEDHIFSLIPLEFSTQPLPSFWVFRNTAMNTR